MPKLLSLLLLFSVIFHPGNLFSQTSKTQPSSTHDYYIVLSGIHGPGDIEKIESNIQKNEGVTYFLGDRYPVRFFTLKSVNPVSAKEFSSWIERLSLYKVEYYGEGIENKERAANAAKKLKKNPTTN